MFSKAKLKRFNEEVGCGPSPTAYDPKVLSKANALSIDKSNRWKENKDETPAPNAYGMIPVTHPRTPGRSALPRPTLRQHKRTASNTKLNTSIASNNSSNGGAPSSATKNKFISPAAPGRLVRSGSCRMKFTSVETQQALLQQLKRERDLLQATVLKLKEKLTRLEQELAEARKCRSHTSSNDQAAANAGESSEKSIPDLQENLQCVENQLQHLKIRSEEAGVESDAGEGCSKSSDDSRDAGEQLTKDNKEIQVPSASTSVASDDAATSAGSEVDTEMMLEHIQHLTQLRDNLEVSVARKDDLIAELQLECEHLLQESRVQEDVVDKCHSHLKTLEDKLSESLHAAAEGSSSENSGGGGLESVMGRVAGLVTRYEHLLDTHTTHCTQHLTSLNDTIATLGEKVHSYEREITQLKTSVTVRCSKITALEETVSELGIASKEKEMMEAMMQEEIRQRNQEMSMLEEGYTSLEQKVAEAEQRAAAVTAERERRETAEKNVEKLTVMVMEAEVLQQFLEKEVLAREQEISSSSNRILELTEELSRAHQEALELQGEAEVQLNQVLVLKASLAAKDYDIDDRDETIITLKDEIVSKQDLASDLQELLTVQKTAKAELNTELQAQNKTVSELRQSVDNNFREVKTLQQQSREKEVEMSCVIDMHRAELDGLRVEKEQLLAQISELKDDYDEGEKKVNQLQEQLEKGSSTVKGLEEKVVELMAEVEDSEITQERRVQDVRQELEELSTQYSESLLELEATRRALNTTSQQHQHDTLLLDAAQHDLVQVQESLSSAHEKLSSKSDEYTTLEQSLKMLSHKFTTLEQAKMSERTEQQEVLQRLSAELQLNQQDRAQLQQELNSVQASNTGFMTQIQQLRQDIAKKSSAVEESKQCIELLRDEKRNSTEQLNTELNSKTEQLLQLNVEHEQLNTQHKELQKQLEHKHEEITDMNKQLEREMNRMRDDRESERTSAEGEKKVLEAQLEQQQEQLHLLLDLKDDFAEKVESLEQTVEDFTAERLAAQETTHKLQQQVTERDVVISNSEHQLTDVRADLDRKQQEVQEQAGRLCQLQELESAVQDANNYKQEVDKLNNLLEHHRGQSCEASSNMQAQLDAAMKQMQQQTTDSDVALNLWRDKCIMLEKMVEPFRKQLESYEAEHALLRSTKSAAQKEVNELSQKYASLLGHQNHKQKIQHVIKLKTDNCRLVEDVAKLRVECDRYRKTVRRLEDRFDSGTRKSTLAGSAAANRLAYGNNKENSSSSDAVTRSPLQPNNKLNRL